MILVKMQVLLAEGGASVPHLTARLQRPDVVETLAGTRVQGLSKLTAVSPRTFCLRSIVSYVSSCPAAKLEECQAKDDLLILDGMKIC